VLAAGPNWLGSPQHFGVGLALAILVFALAARAGMHRLASFLIAVGVISAIEIVWELVEYELRYAGSFHYSAYYDTLADLASSLAGAAVGSALATAFSLRRPGR
jgi:hypothetical protein